MKTSSQIRTEFLDFFRKLEHRIVSSAPVIPHGDPTLMFTNAGMNQFKDVFLGTGTREYRRAADTQKCIRVSGKHNDLEEVGRDTYHHTFFEMLGNWSFGDYFKKEAITWAWELLTKVYKIPEVKLWATVFGGFEKEGLGPDEEAEKFWKEVTSIPSERILRFGKKDNFWEMGDTGPCGPCTEIHIDLGPAKCDHKNEKGHVCKVNGGCARFMEIWNLVFIQFNRLEDGSLKELPAKHVDTGMGFERLVSILQEKNSNYDTDLFTPILAHIGDVSGRKYRGTDDDVDVGFRVIADHIRTLSIAFSDGALPGRGGRGYVLRRILRRAVRFGRQALEIKEPFIYKLVPTVASIFKDIFPEIEARKEHIALLIKSEEESFSRTLDRGIELFNQMVARVGKNRVISGEDAYELYQRDGFPRDLVDLMAREKGLSVDEEGWKKAEEEHKERSKSTKEFEIDISQLEGITATEFLGYTVLSAKSKILKLIGTGALVLDKTPFYAESGGQIGDTGTIQGKDFCFRVDDTQRYGQIIVHIGELTQGDLANLPELVQAEVDVNRRNNIRANHTATHLLHWALREVLGKHVAQHGSVVDPQRLRFDFSHTQAMTSEELEKVEQMINHKIFDNMPVITTVEKLEEAKAKGAMALFGEKYEDTVRVVRIENLSTELCGGTHVKATGDIGCFLILSERSPQAGMRRIEAVTREGAMTKVQEERRIVRDATLSLKAGNSGQLIKRINELQDQVKELKKSGQRKAQSDFSERAKELLANAQNIENTRIVTAALEDISHDDLGLLADMIRKSGERVAGIIISSFEGRAHLAAFASKDLKDSIHAGDISKQVSKLLGGGGGGRNPEFATGGGSDLSKIKEALVKGEELIRQRL